MTGNNGVNIGSGSNINMTSGGNISLNASGGMGGITVDLRAGSAGDIRLSATGSRDIQLNVQSGHITASTGPTNPEDVATKEYVDINSPGTTHGTVAAASDNFIMWNPSADVEINIDANVTWTVNGALSAPTGNITVRGPGTLELNYMGLSGQTIFGMLMGQRLTLENCTVNQTVNGMTCLLVAPAGDFYVNNCDVSLGTDRFRGTLAAGVMGDTNYENVRFTLTNTAGGIYNASAATDAQNVVINNITITGTVSSVLFQTSVQAGNTTSISNVTTNFTSGTPGVPINDGETIITNWKDNGAGKCDVTVRALTVAKHCLIDNLDINDLDLTGPSFLTGKISNIRCAGAFTSNIANSTFNGCEVTGTATVQGNDNRFVNCLFNTSWGTSANVIGAYYDNCYFADFGTFSGTRSSMRFSNCRFDSGSSLTFDGQLSTFTNCFFIPTITFSVPDIYLDNCIMNTIVSSGIDLKMSNCRISTGITLNSTNAAVNGCKSFSTTVNAGATRAVFTGNTLVSSMSIAATGPADRPLFTGNRNDTGIALNSGGVGGITTHMQSIGNNM
jgi:hypothetical protein